MVRIAKELPSDSCGGGGAGEEEIAGDGVRVEGVQLRAIGDGESPAVGDAACEPVDRGLEGSGEVDDARVCGEGEESSFEDLELEFYWEERKQGEVIYWLWK